MKMRAAPVPQNAKRNLRKRRRKESKRKGRKKRKRRKNGSISLASQMRVRTQTDKDLTCVAFSSQQSNTVAKEQRHGGRRRKGGTLRGPLVSACELSRPPAQMWPTGEAGILPGAGCAQGPISGRSAFVSVLLPAHLQLVIPLERLCQGWLDKGSLWGAPGAATAITLLTGGLTSLPDFSLAFSLWLKVIKAPYLKTSIYFLIIMYLHGPNLKGIWGLIMKNIPPISSALSYCSLPQ